MDSGKATFIPLGGRMEGAWLWTQLFMTTVSVVRCQIQTKYLVLSGSVPAIFLLRITTTFNKCENCNNWKLDLKVCEFRGRSHKTVVVKRTIYLSPNKTKDTVEQG
jgi:hypothetical protein